MDRVEVIKLPAHSTNGSVLSAPPTYTSSSSSSSNSSNANNNVNDSDAPLNLSLKPATTSNSSPISCSQPLSQLSNLSQSLLASDRTCKYNKCGAARFTSDRYHFKKVVRRKSIVFFIRWRNDFVNRKCCIFVNVTISAHPFEFLHFFRKDFSKSCFKIYVQ